MHQKYIWLLSLILQEREFNLTGLTRLLLNIRVSGWGCCTSIHSMCSTHTSAFHYGILTYSIWIFQMFEEWHIWNVKPPSSTSCVAPETFQWCLCHRQNMRCSIRLALNWIHNSCILSQDSSLNVLFCLCVHEGFFKYLMVDWKPSDFYYWTFTISHRHLLKDLCWSRQKKCQCDLKMWSECFRTVQRTWWSGSPKVLSSFFCGLFIFSCSGVLLRLIDFIWQSCFQLVSSRLIHIYSIESVNLCFRYCNRAGKQAQWILKCHFVIQQLYIMLWIMIVPLLHWKLKQLMFLLVSILHLNYFSKHQSSVFFRSKKVIWSSCWHEFGYYNIADCKFSSIDLVYISEINWKSQDPHFSWKQFHNRSVY